MRETDHYVVVDKPALLDSQNSREGRPSVVDWLRDRYGFAGLVHRLDFGTSGLMVCARDKASAEALTRSLQRGGIRRTYRAVVMGKNLPDRGEFSEPLAPTAGETTGERPGLAAHTRFRVLRRFANACLVEVDLETGRKHQIRRHFAQAGHPLLGDQLYGRGGAQRLFSRPALHASRLEVDGTVFESEPPEDFQKLLERLARASSGPAGAR